MSDTIEEKKMTLCFPNECRCFDSSKNRVRFWGYDKAIEISFFVGMDALIKLDAESSQAEIGLLRVFDSARSRIHEAADEAYVRSRKDSYAYVLTAEHF